ncbi:hypothetical protein [Chitinivorax sp. B]|uniref:hypothetical protein n=1 Tax=Chitinivorax sp. B TaxID=2502235 RepID=UPI0010F76B29|nr:hypothetical protein [Chitinivorax sp. B]
MEIGELLGAGGGSGRGADATPVSDKLLKSINTNAATTSDDIPSSLAEQRSMGREDGKSCLSEASSFAAAPGEPRRVPAISGQGARVAFFWGLFLAKQEKSRVRRAQPASNYNFSV